VKVVGQTFLVKFLTFALFLQEYVENHRFWQSSVGKTISSKGNFKNSYISKLAQTNTNDKFGHFFGFQPKTRNMIFCRTREKNFEKKCFDFLENKLKRKLQNHWSEKWFTSKWNFEVLVVKFMQTSLWTLFWRK
jgi:hypothetical protein